MSNYPPLFSRNVLTKALEPLNSIISGILLKKFTYTIFSRKLWYAADECRKYSAVLNTNRVIDFLFECNKMELKHFAVIRHTKTSITVHGHLTNFRVRPRTVSQFKNLVLSGNSQHMRNNVKKIISNHLPSHNRVSQFYSMSNFNQCQNCSPISYVAGFFESSMGKFNHLLFRWIN